VLLDATVRPQDDLFRAANGKWKRGVSLGDALGRLYVERHFRDRHVLA